MSKLFDKEGLIGMWQSIKQRLSNCVTRIWWDTSSEIYMYDTFGQSNLDFPIQAVKTDSAKPGLMTTKDKRNMSVIVKNGFTSAVGIGHITANGTESPNLYLITTSYGKSIIGGDDDALSGVAGVQNEVIPVATKSLNGVMSAEDKQSLDNLKSWANSDEFLAANCFNDYVEIAMPHPFLETAYHGVNIPAATVNDAGVMSVKDKKTLDEIASFGKATTSPSTSHPFVFEYCTMMDMDIVMTVGGVNLWCVTVLLNDTEDQTYIATYCGKVLGQKEYSYGHTNTSDGDITTWFLALPTTAEKDSCIIGVA
ncbi:MAG: hypothetical protein K2H16_04645 [Prevotella sp.]|nr:hypothetical protein [Prevotella sp.]